MAMTHRIVDDDRLLQFDASRSSLRRASKSAGRRCVRPFPRATPDDRGKARRVGVIQLVDPEDSRRRANLGCESGMNSSSSTIQRRTSRFVPWLFLAVVATAFLWWIRRDSRNESSPPATGAIERLKDTDESYAGSNDEKEHTGYVIGDKPEPGSAKANFEHSNEKLTYVLNRVPDAVGGIDDAIIVGSMRIAVFESIRATIVVEDINTGDSLIRIRKCTLFPGDYLVTFALDTSSSKVNFAMASSGGRVWLRLGSQWSAAEALTRSRDRFDLHDVRSTPNANVGGALIDVALLYSASGDRTIPVIQDGELSFKTGDGVPQSRDNVVGLRYRVNGLK
jgi:hypothetical protein